MIFAWLFWRIGKAFQDEFKKQIKPSRDNSCRPTFSMIHRIHNMNPAIDVFRRWLLCMRSSFSKMQCLPPMLTMLLLASCKETNNSTVTPEPSSIANLELDGFWTYRTADILTDGGSVVMGFINGNGEVLYVFFDYSIGSRKDSRGYRKCKLQRAYNDKGAVEIPPGSELEGTVVSLIEKADCHEELENFLPSRDKAIEILKTRNMESNLIKEAKVVPR